MMVTTPAKKSPTESLALSGISLSRVVTSDVERLPELGVLEPLLELGVCVQVVARG